MARCRFLAFIMFGTVWASCIYGLVSDINYGESLSLYCLKYCLVFLLFILWESLYRSVTLFVAFSHFLDILFCFCFVFQDFFFFFIYLLSSCESFYFQALKLRGSFLSCVQPTNEPIEGLLYFYYSVFLLSLAYFFILS